jgi:hypothetical protein
VKKPQQSTESLEHLSLLGYNDGDRVYLRTLKPDKNLEATYPKLPALPTAQGVYFVVNGGGQRDSDVTQCRAVFYEHDDLDKTVQRDLWQSLNLPEPTIQVDTGGRSVHSYWVFDQPIPVGQWRSLQSDLLEFSDADRSIKNPSRIMRLAGSIHQKTGQQATIVTQSGHRHTYEALRAAIPVQAKPERNQRPQQPVIVNVMPLNFVLATKFRGLIESGASEGSRNSDGAALARDLIGCENWLRASGIQYDGSAEGLFQNYCARCTPSLDEREKDTIWRSAVGDDPTPSLSVEKLTGCVQAWERKGDRIPSAVEPRRVAKPEQSDTDTDSEDSEIQALISQGSLNPPQLFAKKLATPLKNLAESLGLPVEPFYVCLLPILAARLKAGTQLAIDPVTGYYAPPIIWAGLVGDSGTLKTPILKALTSPLDDLQDEAFEEYQRLFSLYETDLQQWESSKKGERQDSKPKPPALKDLYFSDFTIEAIAASIRHYPDEGYLAHIDELAAFLKSMDAYRSGKGSDRQRWLSSYGGSAIKVNRKSSEPIYLRRTSISLVGGIQPSVLERQVLDDATSEDGLWARFIWVRLPMTTPPGISDGPTFNLSQLLRGYYHSLNQVEAQTYKLSREAIALWNSWNSEIGQLIKQEPSGILRATYPKLKEVAARIALITHIVNAKVSSNPIEATISGGTLDTAIQFTRWLMGQTRMLYCEIGTSDNPKASKVIKFVNRFKGCGMVKARTVRDWWPGKDKPNAKKCREWMAEIVGLGYATDNGLKNEDSNYQIEIVVHVVHKQAETNKQQEIQSWTTASPSVVHLVHEQSPEPIDEQKNNSGRTTWTTDGLRVVHDSNSYTASDLEDDGLDGLPSLDIKNSIGVGIKVGDRVRLLSDIDTASTKNGWSGAVVSLKAGCKGVVQKIITNGYFVLFDEVPNPVTTLVGDIEKCDDDQGDVVSDDGDIDWEETA